MITANEARKLAGPTVKEMVDDIFPVIERAAKEKRRYLRTGWDYEEYPELWINGGYSKSKEWLEAVKILEGLGFKVKFYYSDGSFAVDMYTLIEW